MKARTDGAPARRFYTHLEVARIVGVTAETIRSWVARGEWPEPHDIKGVLWFYPIAAVEQWSRDATWPEGTRFRRPRRAGA